MSRRFERGYRAVFGIHAGGLIRLISVASMIIIPTVVLHEIGLGLQFSVVVSLFYLLTSLILTLATMRIVGVGSFKMYYAIVGIVMVESVIIDSVMSIIERKPIVMAGTLASLVPLSMVVSLLKDPIGVRPTTGYLTDLTLLLAITVLLQLPIYLILDSLTHVYINMVKVIYLDLTLLIVSILIMLMLIMIHKVSGTLSYLKMFGAFIYTMITGDGSFMEFHLLKSSRDANVKIHVVHLKGGSDDAFVVVPYVHTGPISHVGGADFIPLLVKAAKSIKARVIYLHGVGGHEVDPASYDDTVSIVSSIRQAMVKLRLGNHSHVIKAKPIMTVESGDVRLLSIPIANGKNLVFVSRLKKSMDDIPTHVYNEVVKRLGSDVSRLIIIDSQNSFSSDNTWNDEDINDLINGLKRILDTPDEEGELRVKVSHIPRSKIPGSFMEIGDNGVYVMTITFNDERAALVIIDGNNIKPTLADEIRRRLREEGYIAEVATTDNHQYTGFFGKIGYRVVGDGVSQGDLIRLILDTVKGGETEDTEVSYMEFENKVHVVGSDGFYGMTRAASSAVKLLPLHASLLFLAPIVLSIVATYLILH